MPNWTYNSVTVEGDADLLSSIANADFDFNEIHPCPFIKGDGENATHSEGWYEWCCAHWGTKWTARDVDVDYTEGDTILTATFNTAWCAPHGVLAYLTTLFPGTVITNEWQDEAYECVGITVYSDGNIESTSFDPTEYTRDALEAFAASNSWFDFTSYESDMLNQETDETPEEQDTRLETLVRVKVRKNTYDEYVALRTESFLQAS